MATKIETLGDLRTHGYELRAYCEGETCQHTRVVDLEELIATVGSRVRFTGPELGFAGALTCSKCGTRSVRVIISPPLPKGHPARTWGIVVGGRSQEK